MKFFIIRGQFSYRLHSNHVQTERLLCIISKYSVLQLPCNCGAGCYINQILMTDIMCNKPALSYACAALQVSYLLFCCEKQIKTQQHISVSQAFLCLVIFKTSFSCLLSSLFFFFSLMYVCVLLFSSIPAAGICPYVLLSQLWLNILASLPSSFFISSWQHHCKGELKRKLEILFTSPLCTECPTCAV